tara:strand:+ start:3460 stop:4179 length:720 start_codon:yes stop_codon:yes gene_type:complete
MQFVTLKFHPHLQQYTNGYKEHKISINSLDEIRLCLENMFPGLRKFIVRMKSGDQRRQNLALVNKNKRVLGYEDYALNRLTSEDTEFHVVPLLIGAGGGNSGLMSIVIGAALIAAVVLTGGAAAPGLVGFMGMSVTTAATVGGMALSMGISMVISGVMSMIMKPPKPDMSGQQTTDSEARIENKIFNGLQNTTKSNTPVAMVYGRTRLGGQFISGEIRTFDHGKNETVNVNLLFPTGAG